MNFIRRYVYYLILTSIFCFPSCAKGDKLPIIKETILRTEDVIKGKDQSLIQLLQKVRGSVGKRSSGSKAIWSRKNDFGLGIYLSANHVNGVSSWGTRNARYFNIKTEKVGVFERSQIPPIDGKIDLGKTLIADFPLLHFDISNNATDQTILPAEDFYLGIVDNQRKEQSLLSEHPEAVDTDSPLQLYDPTNRTIASKTWNNPIAGQYAIGVGFPQDMINYPNGAVVYAKILTDNEAEQAIIQLKGMNDVEGNIPYNSNVEFFIQESAVEGMSGGGVFNSEGQLLGIMVRSSDTQNAPKITRVVKLSYIRTKMLTYFNNLPVQDKLILQPFLSGELVD